MNTRALQTGFGVALVVSALSVGCGGLDSENTDAENESLLGKSDVLKVKSPTLGSSGAIPVGVRCRPYSVWVPLRWSSVPVDTREIVVSISFDEFRSREGGGVESVLVSEEIIGNLAPDMQRLTAGPVPDGAFIKHHYAGGYCPPTDRESGLVFSVFALPAGNRLKRFEAIGLSTVKALEGRALASGSLLASYAGED